MKNFGLLVALACATAVAHASVDIRSSEDLYRALCTSSEQLLLVKDSFRVWEEPADLTRLIPCVVSRNVTILGALTDGSIPWLDLRFVARKVTIRPHIWLTWQNLVANNFKNGGGGDFEFIAPSTYGILHTQDMNKHAPFCARPSSNNVVYLKGLPLPINFTEFVGYKQDVRLLSSYCEPGGLGPAGNGAMCWDSVLYYDNYATYAIPNSEDSGGSYIITKDNSTKTCGAMIDGTCPPAIASNEDCIKQKIAAMVATEEEVWNSEDLYRALCQTSVTLLRVKRSLRVYNEPSDLTPMIPCVISRNVTITGDLADGSPPWVDLHFVARKVTIRPHIWLTWANMVANNFKYGGGGDFDFIAPSPGGILHTLNLNKHAPFCVMPSATVVANLRGLPLPINFTEFVGYIQDVRLLDNYCEAGGLSGVGPMCWNGTLYYDKYATYAVPNSDDIGSYIMTKTNSTKTCGAFIDPACGASLGNEKCILSNIDAMLAAEVPDPSAPAPSPGGGPGSSSSGLSSGAIAGIVVGSVAGGGLLLAGVAAFVIARHRRASAAGQYAAGKGGDMEAGGKKKGGGDGRRSSSSSSANSSSEQGPNGGPKGTKHIADSFGFSTGHNFAAALGVQQSGGPPSMPASTSEQCVSVCGICDDGTPLSIILMEPLGAGSFGVVMRGLMHGKSVAVKIIAHDAHHAEEVANEVRLMMGFQHPNVLCALHYMTQARVDARSSSSALSNNSSRLEEMLRASRAAATARASARTPNSLDASRPAQGSRPGEVTELWIVSEFCRGGSLGAAARRGDFLTPTTHVLCVAPILRVLKDIAEGMEYLHARQVVHGDLKCVNVLMSLKEGADEAVAMVGMVHTGKGAIDRSSNYGVRESKGSVGKGASSGRGGNGGGSTDTFESEVCSSLHEGLITGSWVAKVADFGLSRALKDDETHRSTRTTGTVTHMPPELLRSGKLMPAGDVYAFGMMMWEVASGRMPYAGLMYGEVVERVVVSNRRPAFPPYVPPAYTALAQRCWAASITERPTFGQVVAALDGLLAEVQQLQAHADQFPGLDFTKPLPDLDDVVPV